jgi:5,10-methylenetetrahydromethanopterin reductase
MAGRSADGVIACVGVDPRLIEAALAELAAGEREAGRAPGSVRVVLWTAAAVSGDGLAALDRVRSFAASAVVPPLVGRLEPAALAEIASIRSRYNYADHMRTDAEHRALVSDELVRRFAIAGTPAQCREQIAAALAYPIDELVLVPFAASEPERAETLVELAAAAPPHALRPRKRA